MKFGLSEEYLEILNNLVILPLKNAGGEVWIFGSRARGDHKKFSDIDLLFELSDIPKGFVSQITEDIEESRIPYKVDLVNIKELASSYRDNVIRDRVKL